MQTILNTGDLEKAHFRVNSVTETNEVKNELATIETNY